MPRKRPSAAADQLSGVLAKTRRRSGCLECRNRRVRCDEKKPSCTRCLEKGLVCSKPGVVLKWECEFISRGQAFGRAGVWSKLRRSSSSSSSSTDDGRRNNNVTGNLPPPLPSSQQWCRIPTIHSWSFVDGGFSTFERDPSGGGAEAVVLCKSHPASPMIKTEPPSLLLDGSIMDDDDDNDDDGDIFVFHPVEESLRRSLSLFPNMPGQGSHLFEYYLEKVCPRTTASSKSASPFASVILPFCMTASPTLFKAIQALGACHWARFNPVYNLAVCLRLKSSALRDLRFRLETEGFSSCSMDSEVLVVVMMLCLCEIVDNCDLRWTVHLKGAKELIRFKRQLLSLSSPSSTVVQKSPGQQQDPVSTFAESFFAFQDVIGRTACGEEVLFGSDYWQDHDQVVDPWMGCSPELVSILSSITEMSRSKRQGLQTDKAFSLQASSLGRRLETLKQDVIDGEDQTLVTTAELKRLAALLYLHCALDGASPSTPLVVTYVRKILQLVSDLLDHHGSVVSVTWPVFMAAAELDPLHDELWSTAGTVTTYGRPLVLRALAAMEESTVSSIARTRAVISKVWQARDLDLQKSAADPATCKNDWEWYVAPISTGMSLA